MATSMHNIGKFYDRRWCGLASKYTNWSRRWKLVLRWIYEFSPKFESNIWNLQANPRFGPWLLVSISSLKIRKGMLLVLVIVKAHGGLIGSEMMFCLYLRRQLRLFWRIGKEGIEMMLRIGGEGFYLLVMTFYKSIIIQIIIHT